MTHREVLALQEHTPIIERNVEFERKLRLGIDHHDPLNFIDQFNNPQFSDCTVRLGSGYVSVFHLHKIILCQNSGYFRKLFSSRFSEGISGEVHLRDCDGTVVHCLLRYMYTGSLTYCKEPRSLISLYKEADYLDIKNIGNLIIEHFKSVLEDKKATRVSIGWIYAVVEGLSSVISDDDARKEDIMTEIFYLMIKRKDLWVEWLKDRSLFHLIEKYDIDDILRLEYNKYGRKRTARWKKQLYLKSLEDRKSEQEVDSTANEY